MQGRAGLLAYWDIQIMIAGMRIDGFGFDLHVAKLDRPADVLQAVGQVWLWLERNHPAIPAPARQPVDEAALVGANVADDVTWPDVPPDNFELGFLIAKSCLQRSNPKPDTLGRKPGLETRHGSTFRSCAVRRPSRRGVGGRPACQSRGEQFRRSAAV